MEWDLAGQKFMCLRAPVEYARLHVPFFLGRILRTRILCRMSESNYEPADVLRVPDIFEENKFYVNGKLSTTNIIYQSYL